MTAYRYSPVMLQLPASGLEAASHGQSKHDYDHQQAEDPALAVRRAGVAQKQPGSSAEPGNWSMDRSGQQETAQSGDHPTTKRRKLSLPPPKGPTAGILPSNDASAASPSSLQRSDPIISQSGNTHSGWSPPPADASASVDASAPLSHAVLQASHNDAAVDTRPRQVPTQQKSSDLAPEQISAAVSDGQPKLHTTGTTMDDQGPGQLGSDAQSTADQPAGGDVALKRPGDLAPSSSCSNVIVDKHKEACAKRHHIDESVGPRNDSIRQMRRGPRCIDIACGARHTAVITQDGRLFTWGSSLHGQVTSIL